MNEERSRTAHESSFRLIVLQHKEPRVVCNSPVPQRELQRRSKSSSCDDVSASISLCTRMHGTESANTKKLVLLLYLGLWIFSSFHL